MKQRASFGSYIRTLRIQNHMTQASLAKKLHVTDKAVSKWERNVSYPDISLLPPLADALGVTVNDLLQESNMDGHPSRLRQIFELSHDIRTPLHIILGCADLAEEHRDDTDLLLRYLESIRVSGRYLLDVIDQAMQATFRENGEISSRPYPSNETELGKYLAHMIPDRKETYSIYDFSGKRILLVEDIEMNREIAKEILKKTNVMIDFAESGEVCVKKITDAPSGYYDLILMDIMMPGIDGYEATRRIRLLRDTEKASIPIIALSANVYEKDRQEALAAGMNDYTEKPIFPEKLFSVMANYL